MTNHLTPQGAAAQPNPPCERNAWRPVIGMGAALALWLPMAAHAIEFGPNGMFSLNGFGEVTFGHATNYCGNCQLEAGEAKDRSWADTLVPGREYKSRGTNFTQVQPFLGAKLDLGKGYKLSGLLSQNWRDGMEDVPGFWREKNIALSHEDYGSVRFGAMTTRTWSVADYPYGTNVGLSGPWASSGAGYGMLTNALRYTSRILDVADGDLVLEATYDTGNTDFKVNKPAFWELYAQYHRGDLVVDATVQDAQNGTPSAWSHGPFTGLTPSAADDRYLSSSSQGIALVMARYQIDPKLEVSGGIRRNWWSGANAVQNPVTQQWNNMFNVDWDGTLNGVKNPGYAAMSIDVMAGLRYRMGQWTASGGVVHLGTALTGNPSDRGQKNSALIGVLALQYDYGNGFKVNVQTGAVHYARLGLSPMSMPSNSSFTEVDSRVARDGNWITVGALYAF